MSLLVLIALVLFLGSIVLALTAFLYQGLLARGIEGWQGELVRARPAFEPSVLARKPLKGNVAANVLAHGVGALNISGCRVGTDSVGWGGGAAGGGTWNDSNMGLGKAGAARPVEGRWPANVILDPEAGAMLDAQTGEMRARGNVSPTKRGAYDASSFMFAGSDGRTDFRDNGGVSRLC